MYDIHSVRKDFPVLDEVIYLDNGATTQTPVPAVNAMNDYFLKYAANHGRGAHRLARQTTDNYEDARDRVAEFLNTTPENTVLTKNATESINMVALGLNWEAGDHVITSLVEHHSNLLPWMRLREKGVEVTIVGSDSEGCIDPKDVDAAITDRTKLVSVNHVSNVFGSIRDVEKITKLVQKSGAMVLVDGSQSAGHMAVDVKRIGCDFFVTPGHKGMLGPQGTGILCIKQPDIMEPVYVGGGTVHAVTTESYELEPSPSKFEAGTPNIPGIIGLGRAVEYVQEIGVEDIEKHEKELSAYAAKRLAEIEGVDVYGPENRAGVVPFNVEGMNPHDVAMILDETRKICVRSGFHCAMPSVEMLGVEGTVRASFAMYNTEEEVDSLVEGVGQITMLA